MDQVIQECPRVHAIVTTGDSARAAGRDRLVHEIVQERPELQPSKAEILIESPLPGVLGHTASSNASVTNLLDNAVKFVALGVKLACACTARLTRQNKTLLRRQWLLV